jgi:ketosteroid isomerase-like protein
VSDPPPAKPGRLEILLDWIAALRRGDLEGIDALLDPDVVWHGLSGELECAGRRAVVDAVAEQVPSCLRLDALELIAAPRRLVLGTHSRDLPEPPGTALAGQIYNAFEDRNGRIVTIRDFATRAQALRWAGAGEEAHWR